ncbi:MAG: Hsp70 family protein, partial [Ramlibacter sp.]
GHAGPDRRPVPSSIFVELATWHLINFQYSPRRLAEAQTLRTNYADPGLHRRLLAVLQQRLGHRLASEVELAKIRCSEQDAAARIDLGGVESGLEAVLAPQAMAAQLADLLGQVVDCAEACVRQAGLGPGQLDAVYLTGGSSALATLQARLRERFPGVPLVEGDLFGGVAAGLAYAAQQ